jgi:hypothetical protein
MDALEQQVSDYFVDCFFVTLVELAALLKYLQDLETNYLERQLFFEGSFALSRWKPPLCHDWHRIAPNAESLRGVIIIGGCR